MKIESVKLADFCEDNTTVSVSSIDDDGKKETFHVQTTGGRYRSELGCWIFTDKDGENLDRDDYQTFDIPTIIDEAVEFIQSIE